MVNHDSTANQRAKKRARKEEQAAQHESAESSTGATASTSQAIEQLSVGVQEIDLHAVIENSPLAARVTQLDETLQDLTRGLNESRDSINETISGLDENIQGLDQSINGVKERLDERINGVRERLAVIRQDVTAAANVANAAQAQFDDNLGPFGNFAQRLSVLELRQDTHMLSSIQAVSELCAGLHSLRAEWAAIKQAMANKAELEVAIFELVEFRGLLNQISERLGRLEAMNRDNAQEQRPDVMTEIINRLALLEAQERPDKIAEIDNRLARLEAKNLDNDHVRPDEMTKIMDRLARLEAKLENAQAHPDEMAELIDRIELLEAQELPNQIAEINERLDHLEAENFNNSQEHPDEMAEIKERIARLEAALLVSDEEDA
ncbi:hypothetical protein B0T20DRAFT_511778 [Sordaria brevicollis]|uniref:Uncharacterized protein n=1 Tax=Sordaria brevicollis TaxID=83679 RepID=A0AAE0NRK4_SORBR|nr:hypothetical protein B0T20DRAFT_511778 [Sordaria brevicollis]